MPIRVHAYVEDQPQHG